MIWSHAILASVIEGIAQWFPVSYFGHAIAIQNIFKLSIPSFVLFLEFASALAAIVLLWEDIVRIFSFKDENSKKYLLMILISLVPLVLAALFLRNRLPEILFGDYIVMGGFFAASGIFIFLTKFAKERKDEPGWITSIIIGLVQALWIFPGFSRVGLTISTGMFSGVKKEESLRFSLIISIPALIFLAIVNAGVITTGNASILMLIVTSIIAFGVSLGVIMLLLKIVREDKFHWFGLYDFAVGAALIIYGLMLK